MHHPSPPFSLFLAAGDHACRAAVRGGHVLPLEILLPGPAEGSLHAAAALGVHPAPLCTGVLKPNLEEKIDLTKKSWEKCIQIHRRRLQRKRQRTRWQFQTWKLFGAWQHFKNSEKSLRVTWGQWRLLRLFAKNLLPWSSLWFFLKTKTTLLKWNFRCFLFAFFFLWWRKISRRVMTRFLRRRVRRRCSPLVYTHSFKLLFK